MNAGTQATIRRWDGNNDAFIAQQKRQEHDAKWRAAEAEMARNPLGGAIAGGGSEAIQICPVDMELSRLAGAVDGLEIALSDLGDRLHRVRSEKPVPANNQAERPEESPESALCGEIRCLASRVETLCVRARLFRDELTI